MRVPTISLCSSKANRTDITYVWPSGSCRFYSGSGIYATLIPTSAIGGSFLSPVGIHSRAPDKLDLVGVGSDGAALHKSRNGTVWNPDSDLWVSLGGDFVTPITVTSTSANCVDIFGVDRSHTIQHKYRDDSEPYWSGWDTLNGHWHSGVGAVRRSDGLIDLVAINPALEICYKLYNRTNSHPWESLGGRFSSLPIIISCGNSRVDIFCVGIDKHVYHKSGSAAGNDTPIWTPAGQAWEDLGGDFDSPPSAVSCSANRLDIFASKANGNIMWRCWKNGAWEAWTLLASNSSNGVTAVSKGSGKIDVFHVDDSVLWVKTYSDGVWQSSWTKTDGTPASTQELSGNPPPYIDYS